MSVASVYGTRLPSAGGLAAPWRSPPTDAAGAPASTHAKAISRGPAADAGQWTAAIAMAMAQLGLAGSPGRVPTGSPMALGDASPASRRAALQVQQYRSIASTSSRLVQALDAGASGAPSAAGLTAALQGLWTSLGTASYASADGSGSLTAPHLPTFLQSLASHVGESGVSGLRGVFVDALA